MPSRFSAGDPEEKKGRNEALSRSKLELLLDCPRCFYLDRVLGVPRPDNHLYALNLAVDALFKKEFDTFRNTGEPHPLMQEWNIDAVPFFHPSLNDWREAARGVRTVHEESGFVVHGAVDDVWKAKSGELLIVDYKCTGRPVGAGDTIRQSYKRQVEVYQWIVRRMGFRVSKTAYFVFAAPDRNRDAFDRTLHFSTSIAGYVGDDSWVTDALLEARRCLELPRSPMASANCEWCGYVTRREGAEQPTL